MPVISYSNNQLLPANQRASDVAAQAVEGIADVQQQRINAAFHVQGIQCAVYHRMTSGLRCSCRAGRHLLSARLGLDASGKASSAMINSMLTGGNFSVDSYGGAQDAAENESERYGSAIANYSGDDPSSSDLPLMWNVSRDDGRTGEILGDDGINNTNNLDNAYNGFDFDSLAFGDSACPVCYGTGFVGGYVLYNGNRCVIPCDSMDITAEGELHYDDSPFSATSMQFSFPLILPQGFVSLDVMHIMNGWDAVPCRLFIDGIPASRLVLKAKSDGRTHIISGKFSQPTKFTHFEFQENLSTKSAYIEFPKVANSSRLDIIETLENFQVMLSPDIPIIDQRDIICDSLYGKALYVLNSTWLNTRQRQMLGWESDVRVIQPQESFYNLPRRKPIHGQQVVNPVIGNLGNRP